MKQNVWRLKITMHYIFTRQNLKSFNNLFKILIHFAFWEMSILFDFLIKSPSITELIEKVEIVDSFQNFNKFDDMWTIYLGKNLNFVQGAFLQFRIFFESFYIDHFNSHFLCISTVDSPVNLPVLSFTNLLIECVVLDYFYHPLKLVFKW